MMKFLSRLWLIYWNDRKSMLLFREIQAELRVKHPEMHTLDLLDLTCDVYKQTITKARLFYTLKHGSVNNPPTTSKSSRSENV